MTRRSAHGGALTMLFAAFACGPRPPASHPTAATLDGGWRTLRAEHRVTVTAHTDRGDETRSLRGVIAVERPDRFRLRALGPGGIALFDLLSIGGQVTVMQAIRDVGAGSALGTIVTSLAGDLATAYDLAPRPPDRHSKVGAGDVTIEEPGRTVRLSAFRAAGGKSFPGRIEIDNRERRYHVVVEVADTTLDEPLDPALFVPR